MNERKDLMCKIICFGKWCPPKSWRRLRPINNCVKRNVPTLGHGEIVNHANTRWVECLKGATQTNKPKKLSQYFGYDNRCLNIEKMSLLWLLAPETLTLCGSRKVQKTVAIDKCPKEWPNVAKKLSLKLCIKQNLQSVQKGIVGLRRQSPSVSRRLPPHPHLGQVSPISVNNGDQIFMNKNEKY